MFTEKALTIIESVDARQQRFEADDAWALLESGEEIVVGQGKKIHTFTPAPENREQLLKLCLGRSGNLRAPTLKVGARIIVGFNEEMYQRYL